MATKRKQISRQIAARRRVYYAQQSKPAIRYRRELKERKEPRILSPRQWMMGKYGHAQTIAETQQSKPVVKYGRERKERKEPRVLSPRQWMMGKYGMPSEYATLKSALNFKAKTAELRERMANNDQDAVNSFYNEMATEARNLIEAMGRDKIKGRFSQQQLAVVNGAMKTIVTIINQFSIKTKRTQVIETLQRVAIKRQAEEVIKEMRAFSAALKEAKGILGEQ